MVYPHALQQVAKQRRSLFVQSHQHTSRRPALQQHPCVAESPVERLFSMSVCRVIAMTLQANGDIAAYGIVCRLHEECRFQQLLALLRHLAQEKFTILQAPQGSGGDDGVGHGDACLF